MELGRSALQRQEIFTLCLSLGSLSANRALPTEQRQRKLENKSSFRVLQAAKESSSSEHESNIQMQEHLYPFHCGPLQARWCSLLPKSPINYSMVSNYKQEVHCRRYIHKLPLLDVMPFCLYCSPNGSSSTASLL